MTAKKERLKTDKHYGIIDAKPVDRQYYINLGLRHNDKQAVKEGMKDFHDKEKEV